MKAAVFLSKIEKGIDERMIEVELKDGVYRKGKLTQIIYSSLRFKDIDERAVAVKIPLEIELNGDPTDRIALNRISYIEFV